MKLHPQDGSSCKLDYQLCSLPGSRLQFRGPLPDLDNPFVAVLGGTESFGKYVETPYPALLADWLGLPVANLSIPQAGLSLFSDEPVLLDAASRAEVTVLQVLGAQNMSNRLYSVHSRRNDRFLGVSPALRELFPKVDFTEINFTGHLLAALSATSDSAFATLVEELKWAWVQRMRRILSIIRGEVLLLWISERPMQHSSGRCADHEPHFVDAAMVDELRNDLAGVVEVTVLRQTQDGKIFEISEMDAAMKLPGPSVHRQIAEALAPAFQNTGLARARPYAQPGLELRASRAVRGPQ